MELISGRDFTNADRPAALRKAIVNRAFALKFLEKANPLGRIFYDSGKPDKPYQVIGVVNDTKYYTLREAPAPIVFVSLPRQTDRKNAPR